ncbi:MAG: hypothetical protein SF182_27120 [Deltaproteobacteria bacterium]|nr:hypothetical protein [Deltaproteobacteria bacterium]
MLFIDMTQELSVLLTGLNIALLVSAMALVGNVALRTWTRSMSRPRLSLDRPALAGAR